MEENISQTPTPVTTESTSAPPVSKPPFGSWWKVGGLVVGALLVASGLFFAGYQYSQKQVKPTTPPVATPTPDTRREPTGSTETANWKTYNNKELGIEFMYPSEWGQLQTNDDERCLLEGGSSREYQGHPCVHVMVLIPSLNNAILLGTQSKLFANYNPGRGGYFGDRFTIADKYQKVSAEEFVRDYCIKRLQTETGYCKVQTNPNGVLYVKSFETTPNIPPEENQKTFYYFLYHPNHSFPGIVLSTERLLGTLYAADSEKTVDQILSTFQFTQ